MTNLERYAKEIAKIALNGKKIAIDSFTNTPMPCDFSCDRCKLIKQNEANVCDGLKDWARDEWNVTLSDRDKSFLNFFPETSKGWIVREKEPEYLFLFSDFPIYNIKGDKWHGENKVRINPNLFQFIDVKNKPWSLQELKKKV